MSCARATRATDAPSPNNLFNNPSLLRDAAPLPLRCDQRFGLAFVACSPYRMSLSDD